MIDIVEAEQPEKERGVIELHPYQHDHQTGENEKRGAVDSTVVAQLEDVVQNLLPQRYNLTSNLR
jgi:hypothetical protein